MKTVTSKDGATIAYNQTGQGPLLILVTGALGFRSDGMQQNFVSHLEPHFTVINYDRRGRGDSGDTAPYAVEREIEDIEALIDATGGTAYLYGLSSGAVLALKAANQLGAKVTKLALYEPPFIIDDSRPPVPVDYVEQLDAAIAAGDRGKAVEIFMIQALLIPAEFVEMMRNAPPGAFAQGDVKPPDWSDMEAVAHTLAYDGAIIEDIAAGKQWPKGTWDTTSAKTVVIAGENSEAFFHDGAKALVNDLPHGKYQLLQGQDHAVSPSALAPALIAFFAN